MKTEEGATPIGLALLVLSHNIYAKLTAFLDEGE